MDVKDLKSLRSKMVDKKKKRSKINKLKSDVTQGFDVVIRSYAFSAAITLHKSSLRIFARKIIALGFLA